MSDHFYAKIFINLQQKHVFLFQLQSVAAVLSFCLLFVLNHCFSRVADVINCHWDGIKAGSRLPMAPNYHPASDPTRNKDSWRQRHGCSSAEPPDDGCGVGTADR